jgi:hypothetical protein
MIERPPRRAYLTPGMKEAQMSFELCYILEHALTGADVRTALFALRAD